MINILAAGQTTDKEIVMDFVSNLYFIQVTSNRLLYAND